MDKNIFVIFVMSMIAICCAGCGGTKMQQQDIVYTTDGVHDWPSEFHDSANSIPVYDFRFPMKLLWKEVGHNINAGVVSGNTYFLVDMTGAKIWFVGQNITTGEIVFNELVDKAPMNVYDPRLIVRDDMVYFAVTATDEYQVWSYMYAYNMKAKKIVWHKEVQWTKEGTDKMMYTGVLLDGNIVVAYFGDKQEGPKMIAYTATTGEELWRCSEPRGRMYENDPVISNGKIFVLDSVRYGQGKSEIIAINILDGTRVWQRDIQGITHYVGLLAYNGKLHFGSTEGMYIVDQTTGNLEVMIPRNEKEKLTFLGSHILTDGQYFYTELTGGVVCYTERGDVLWKTDNLMYPNLRFTTKDCVWASSAGRFLVALNTKTGKIVNAVEVGTSKRATNKFDITDVAVKDRTVFITTEAGDVYAFEGTR